ncbi:MAG: haloalkane dehalogenase [Nitrososphaerales archaeon]
MNLQNITLVVHDWGSALGFHYAMRNEANVKGIAFMEFILKPFKWEFFRNEEVRKIFKAFRTPEVGWDMIVNQNFFVEQILGKMGSVRNLSEEEMNHYRKPFEKPEHRKPVWKWPNEIPIEGIPQDVTEAVRSYNQKFQESNLPKLLFYAEPGALVLKPLLNWCKNNLKNLKIVNIGRGVHYLQEDNPHLIGSDIAKWYESLVSMDLNENKSKEVK